MKVTYIHHSCFSVEMEHVIFLFDYYKGNLPDFNPDKHIFVFASHKHGDHFDPVIFDLNGKYPHVTFILSKDIRMSKGYMEKLQITDEMKERILYTSKNVTLTLPVDIFNEPLDSSLTVETLTSTDAGVAFIVTWQQQTIYHAGDLNWWTWIGEETDEEYQDMTNRFQSEIQKIKSRKFDLAFLPLDPRQGIRFYWGFDYFMKNTNTILAFPMHFWLDYTVISQLKVLEETKEYSDRVMDIKEEGQVFYTKSPNC
ncbi:hydrolase [Anaerocolumna cellulosilytica]|uniref:Hydrolase n=1 Tax=Anaerocolumna cellulosilytica TaxID=433286 RepID=A0A6S6QYY7_9FIRM|nr:MBL fold metallo-hydrolase [Anaerocolumna cellulosilytica]MBB5196751.1 L-ascorbate metabolism protein UlaG (beta-lactamase superfamily) [Anaerocolumna cellulosilytica]BCJ95854.1 hydrolase [Anaerocolumna cellulosilytica]